MKEAQSGVGGFDGATEQLRRLLHDLRQLIRREVFPQEIIRLFPESRQSVDQNERVLREDFRHVFVFGDSQPTQVTHDRLQISTGLHLNHFVGDFALFPLGQIHAEMNELLENRRVVDVTGESERRLSLLFDGMGSEGGKQGRTR